MRNIGVTLLLGAALLAGCGDDDNDPAGPGTTTNTVVMTRANGSTISFGSSVYAWCGAWEDGEVAVPAVHVLVGGPNGFWMLRAVSSDIRIGEPLTFPNSYTWDDPDGADIFVLDPPNELSTQEGESSGSVVFQEASCTTSGRIRFHVDATIGSELAGLPSITARGDFSARITGRP